MRVDLTTVIRALNGDAFTTGRVNQVEKTDDDGKVVCDDEGNPVMVRQPEELTIRDLLVSAYARETPGIPLVEKVRRGTMAQKIYEADRYLEMAAEDVVQAKDLINATVDHPVIMMRTVALLDPPAPTAVPEDTPPEA